MTRAEISEKLKHIKKGSPPINSETGDFVKGECYELGEGSISQQIRDCKEGPNKIFFFEVTKIDSEGDIPGITLSLSSETVYLSPTKYV
jgi:hypothetical protein